jgi:hypothetical protein
MDRMLNKIQDVDPKWFEGWSGSASRLSQETAYCCVVSVQIKVCGLSILARFWREGNLARELGAIDDQCRQVSIERLQSLL